MLKARTCLLPVALMLAGAFAAPAVQASELVKLGKLIVTGKRTPELRPAVPTTRETPPALERSGSRSDSAERPGATPARGGVDFPAVEPGLLNEPAPAERAPDPAPRQGSVSEPARSDRLSRVGSPSNQG